MKRFLIAILVIIVLLVIGYGLWAYHAGRANAAPPYTCGELNLISAKKSPDDNQRYYNFDGTCQVKIPQGSSWIYQAVCVNIAAAWDRSTNTAVEVTQIGSQGATGSVNLQLQCQDDPWVSDGHCAIVKSSNTTSYPQFSQQFTFYDRQYPPLARDGALASPKANVQSNACAPAAAAKPVTSPQGAYPVPQHYAQTRPINVTNVYVVQPAQPTVIIWWRPCPFWNPWCNWGPSPVPPCPYWNPWCNPWVPPTVCPWWNPACNPWYPPNPCPWWNRWCNPWVPPCPWWSPLCRNNWLPQHACPPWNPNCAGPIAPVRCPMWNPNCLMQPIRPRLPLIAPRPVAPIHPLINPLHPIGPLKPIEPVLKPIRPPIVRPLITPIAPIKPPIIGPKPPIQPIRPPIEPVRPPIGPKPPIEPIRPRPPIEPIRPRPPIEPIRPRPPIEPIRPMPPIEPERPMRPIEPIQPGPFRPIEPQMPPMRPVEPMPPMQPMQPSRPPKELYQPRAEELSDSNSMQSPSAIKTIQ